MQSEPKRCLTCQCLIFESGGHHITCADQPLLSKAGNHTSIYGSVFEPLHRPLVNSMPAQPDNLGRES